MYLPQELLSNVLSRLDVDSLLRFKTVCKEWCSLIEDRAFIRSHRMKSRGHWVFESSIGRHNFDRYRFVDSCFGLILEHNYNTRHSRLKNPSTGKILELPDLGDLIIPLKMKMCHIKSSDVLKLAVPCLEGFKVMTVGIDIGWRDIDIPSPKVFLGGTVMVREAYFMFCRQTEIPHGFELICLEMGSERISRIKVPDGFSFGPYQVAPLAWGESLALAGVIEDGVSIWVLEDPERVRWAEKKIIIVPLKFMGPRDKENMFIREFQDNGLLINYAYKEFWLLDVVSGTFRWSHRAPEGQQFAACYFFVPSLQHPKGENETKH